MDPKTSTQRNVQIVYYLSRGGLLEQPHLLEVPTSSTEGLYLRDVKRRLMIVRGQGMPSSFSWSYKRSYKTGYVWQDLSDDDLIFPANGCEYVIKGCKINADRPSPRSCLSTHSKQATASRNEKDPLPLICPIKAHIINTSKGNSLAKISELSDKDAEDYSFGGSQTSDLSLESDQIPVFSTNKDRSKYPNANHDEGRQSSRLIREQNRHEEKRLPIANPPSIKHVEEYTVFTKHGSPTVNLTYAGADVATQTEGEGDLIMIRRADLSTISQRLTQASNSASGLSCQRESLNEIKQASVELTKGEISPPPCSISSIGASSTSSVDSGKHKFVNTALIEDQITTSPVSSCSDYNHNQALGEAQLVEQLTKLKVNDCLNSPPSTAKGDKLASNIKHKPYKICSSSGFLQFVSCGGGLELKDQEGITDAAEIIPANPAIISTNQFSKGDNSKKLSHLKGWANFNFKRPNNIKSSTAGQVNEQSPPALIEKQGIISNNIVDESSSSRGCPMSERNRSDGANQLSSSNRSSNASEAELIRYHLQQYRRKASSSSVCASAGLDHHHDEWRRSFPVFGVDSLTEPAIYAFSDNSLTNKSASAVKSVPPAQPNTIDGTDYFTQLASSMAKTSNAASQNDLLVEELHSPALLVWDRQPPSQKSGFKNRDERPLPPERSKAEWEKALQYAVEMSLPPSDFNRCLQECLHCGRRFRPDSLKVHTRSCKNQTMKRRASN